MAFGIPVFIKYLFLLVTLFLGFRPLSAQAQRTLPYLASELFDPSPRDNQRLRLVFYNVENLFDYFDDSTTVDEAYTPFGTLHWSKSRYEHKLNRLAKTIIGIGGWEPPTLIGLCEIENRYVLESLTRFTQLKTFGYEIVHQDSEDRRGIDVALLYRPDKFELLDYEYYPIRFPFDPQARTRDILHVKGLLLNQDTLHYFVNHWPSKFGGEFETAPKRMYAGRFLRLKVDSLLAMNPRSNIIITGDFNDEPDAASLTSGLGAEAPLDSIGSTEIYNLMYEIRFKAGTHSFEGKWSLIDQFIVSGVLLQPESTMRIKNRTAIIFDMPWLMVEGATGALRPFRTYQGPRYLGGYSDHLPIYLDLILK